MNIFLATVLIIFVLVLLYLFLVTPNLTGKQKAPYLLFKNIAHRGLHNKEDGVPENSLLAAELAAQAGYPIELDVRLTKDDEVIVFHDDTLNRVSNGEGDVDDFTLEELQKMSLLGSNETIPTFKEFLKKVGGRVPLVIEIKNNKNNNLLCKKTVEELEYYKGHFVVKSFQPDIVLWFKRNHPNIIRGQLATRPSKGESNPIVGFFSSHMVLNFLTRPHFISYDLRYTNNFTYKNIKKMGALVLVWTVRDDKQYNKAKEENVDGIIFENISPSVSFKKQFAEKAVKNAIAVSMAETKKSKTVKKDLP